MSPDQRRRSARLAAGWSARYRLDTQSVPRACRIINVSGDGAAAELYGLGADESPAGPLYLELPSTSAGAAVELSTIVRNHARTASGEVIVGVEFEFLTDRQKELLELLIRLRVTA
jgi:PilZ domain